MSKIASVLTKSILWLTIGVVSLVVNIVVALYAPWFQRLVVEVLPDALSTPERVIKVEELRLRFPLDVEVGGLAIIEHGDTTIGATHARVDVKALPLLGMRVEADRADITDGIFTLGTPDSLTYLRVRRTDLSVKDARVSLVSSRVDVDEAVLSRGSVSLTLLPDSVATPDTTSTGAKWVINARRVNLANLDYRMAMMPTIDSLYAHVGNALLIDGVVDMTDNHIHARKLAVDSLTAAYFYPTPQQSAAFVAKHPAPPADVANQDSVPSLPWTITADALSLTSPSALYAMTDVRPSRGLDMEYLQVKDIVIKVDSFYNRGSQIRVPLRELRGVERCGIRLAASGVFEMDSVMMRARDFKVSTPVSDLTLDGYMGLGNMMTDPNLPLGATLEASISLYDVLTAMPSFAPLIKGLPQSENIGVSASLDGTPSRLNVAKLSALMPRHAYVNLSGVIDHPMDPKRIAGNLNIDGKITDVAFAKSRFLDPSTASMVNIPPFTLSGNVNYAPTAISGDLRATSGAGALALKADWVSTAEQYSVDLRTDHFPVNAFLPTLGVGPVSATLKAQGRGYDPLKATTDIDLHADVESAYYQGNHYSDICAKADLRGGAGTIEVVSGNPGCSFDISGEGNLVGDMLDWTFDADVREIDLMAMKITDTPMGGTVAASGRAKVSRDLRSIDADVRISDIDWRMDSVEFVGDNIAARILSNDTMIDVDVDNYDFHACFRAPMSINTLVDRFTLTGNTLMSAVRDKSVNVPALSGALPEFDMKLTSGGDNVFARYLATAADLNFERVDITANKDSLITLDAVLYELAVGNTKLDTIRANIREQEGYLYYTASLRNRPGTLDDWASVDANGYMANDNLAVLMQQRNIKGETGFLVGAQTTMNDSTFKLKIAPYHPTIAYKQWTVNPDNEIEYNYRERHLDANLRMNNELSSLRFFTDHTPGSHTQEDVVVQASDIKISDWISFNPFAPPMEGNVSADMRFNWNKKDLNGRGTISVSDLVYGNERVGTFDLDANVTTTPGGPTRADVAMMVDGVKTITASGVLNDSTLTNPFLLDFSMIHFPLSVVNPFLPPGTAKLSGVVNGRMDITGDAASPVFNGYIDFDSAVANVTMLGTQFKFTRDQVPVRDNVVTFKDFKIAAINSNPLNVEGTVDMGDLTNPKFDLAFKANNMQIVGSEKPRGADVYGMCFIGLDAQVKGNAKFMDVRATLDVLPGTNVTYVMQDAESVIASQQTEGMVKFVNFNDSTAIAAADTLALEGMLVGIDAILNLQSGSTVNIDLSPDGKNKVQVLGQGSLNYTKGFMDGVGRMTGRLNINSGYARYTLPPLSEKKFDFQEGSYISFNGSMLNPILNLHAIDKVKSSVSQEGQSSRLVTFDVMLGVTNTLQHMNIAFDLSTDDDLSVSNELQAMSPEQRANQAMNILLYGVYSGAGNRSDANIGANMLTSFLESQLNQLASRAIKGVDVSFGIDRYNSVVDGNTATATSYSYQVSKSLFNDRVRIIIGGNYTADANNTEEGFSENLINDVSFEYMMNKTGTMYIKIFRHVGYESILEGEVTQTGVGFVYKRKIRKIGDMFRWFPTRRRSRESVLAPTIALPPVESPVTTPTVESDESK